MAKASFVTLKANLHNAVGHFLVNIATAKIITIDMINKYIEHDCSQVRIDLMRTLAIGNLTFAFNLIWSC